MLAPAQRPALGHAGVVILVLYAQHRPDVVGLHGQAIMMGEGVNYVPQTGLQPLRFCQRLRVDITLLVVLDGQHRHYVIRVCGEMLQMTGQGFRVLGHVRAPLCSTLEGDNLQVVRRRQKRSGCRQWQFFREPDTITEAEQVADQDYRASRQITDDSRPDPLVTRSIREFVCLVSVQFRWAINETEKIWERRFSPR